MDLVCFIICCLFPFVEKMADFDFDWVVCLSFFRVSGERVDLVFNNLLTFFFCRKDGYESLSSIGMVLAVDDGLKEGMDSMSVFIIHPF